MSLIIGNAILLSGGASLSNRPPEFSIKVNNVDATLGTDYYFSADAGTGNWELAFLNSCTITFSRIGNVDVFLVGGGASGDTGGGSGAEVWGGAGGKGGTRVTQYGLPLVKNASYIVTIGASGQSTSGFGSTAASGGGSNGGYGAHANNSGGTGSASGSDGEYAFGSSTSLIQDLSGRKYGAGGGGACCETSGYVSGWGSHSGGTTGGGSGGSDPRTDKNGKNGAKNTGSGGGGAVRNAAFGNGTPGSGGSGIIILRNARS